jgi:hypothetical protein
MAKSIQSDKNNRKNTKSSNDPMIAEPKYLLFNRYTIRHPARSRLYGTNSNIKTLAVDISITICITTTRGSRITILIMPLRVTYLESSRVSIPVIVVAIIASTKYVSISISVFIGIATKLMYTHTVSLITNRVRRGRTGYGFR